MNRLTWQIEKLDFFLARAAAGHAVMAREFAAHWCVPECALLQCDCEVGGMNTGSGEFEEISHCGGQVIFRVVTGEDGQRAYQITYRHSRGGPMRLFAIYALREGVAVGTIKLGGIGQPWNPPPISSCFPVYIASDSQGKFGHQARSVGAIGVLGVV
jgi:hypothetical protein